MLRRTCLRQGFSLAKLLVVIAVIGTWTLLSGGNCWADTAPRLAKDGKTTTAHSVWDRDTLAWGGSSWDENSYWDGSSYWGKDDWGRSFCDENSWDGDSYWSGSSWDENSYWSKDDWDGYSYWDGSSWDEDSYWYWGKDDWGGSFWDENSYWSKDDAGKEKGWAVGAGKDTKTMESKDPSRKPSR